MILQRKGYRLWDEGEMVCAEKDGWDFTADDAVQLLGLIAIFEHRAPSEWTEYWWKLDEPELDRKLPTSAPQYSPFPGPKRT